LVKDFQGRTSALNVEYAKTVENKNDTAKQKIQEQYNVMFNEYNVVLKKEFKNIENSITAVLASDYLDPSTEFGFLDSLASNLKKTYPSSSSVDKFKLKMDKIATVAVGKTAPELVLNDPDGKSINLSSLKGKYVLIDFWASWCGPCRQENPNVVKMYSKFKSKGFEIYGVSLDDEKDNWIAAIKKDKLTWAHVSDLKGWQSEAASIYQVTGIPATYLLDKEGKIIAKNLRGKALEDKLAEVLL